MRLRNNKECGEGEENTGNHLISDGGRYVRTNKSAPSHSRKVLYVGLFFSACWAFSIFFQRSQVEVPTLPVSQNVNTSVRGKGNKNWWEVDQPLLENWPHPIKTRTDIGKYLNLLQMKRGVEVGVQRGRFAMRTLSQWAVCETYKLVDLWGVDPNYKEPGSDSNAVKNGHMMAAQALLKKWTDKGVTEFFPMRSDDAAKKFPDNYFDFVYIDARHDYCAVLEDIRLYYSKLRPGGIIAGHDFVDAQYALERLGPVSLLPFFFFLCFLN